MPKEAKPAVGNGGQRDFVAVKRKRFENARAARLVFAPSVFRHPDPRMRSARARCSHLSWGGPRTWRVSQRAVEERR